VADEAANAVADDPDEARRHGVEDDGPRHARIAEGYLEVLAGKDPPAKREPGDLGQQ
jgi:hypothetical protein